MSTTLTKIAFDKAIAELHNSKIHQHRKIEIGGELNAPLRTSSNGLHDVISDADSDVSSNNNSYGSNSSYGSNRSFMSISDDNSSPSSAIGLGQAFMTSARGSRLLQDEELARLSDMQMDPSDVAPTSPHLVSLQDRNSSTRSPSLGKATRSEYFAKIKNEFAIGNTLSYPSTPPSPLSSSSLLAPPPLPASPPDDNELLKRVQRQSSLSASSDGIPFSRETDKTKEKKTKEMLKEEKMRKKQEKKDKAKGKPDPPSIAGPENNRIMQQLLGAMRPKSLSSRANNPELEENLRRPIDISSPTMSPKESLLRRSSSFKDLDLEETRLIPKYARILGSPVDDFSSNADEERSNWRKSKMVKNVVSDPYPAVPSLLPPPPPPPTTNEASEDETKQKRSPKVLQLLGEMPPQQISSLSVVDVTTAEPYVNDEEVDEEDIVFSDVREQSGQKLVKGATLKRLVERLTCESISDTNFLLQFIITYRSFTNPHELLELLKIRFETGIEISPDISENEREITSKKQLIVRLRVYNVIRQWIDKQWVDFMEDSSLVEKMLSYAPMLNEVVSQKSSNSSIDKVIEKKLQTEGEKKKNIMFSIKPPDPYIPSVPREKLKLLDIHPEEIARQMTLMEYAMFAAIKPWEYLCWNTKAKQTKSSNILVMINKFNTMNKWVQKEVLTAGETAKQRAIVIGKFLEICEYLRALKNYNGIMEIMSGLNASGIHRLKSTWACLSSKQMDLFQEINALTSGNNYKNLRTALHTLQPPCIPYLGMYLTDLTFINDGIPLYLPNTSLINFDKCRKASASVLEIMQYQQTPFCLATVEDIHYYLSMLDKLTEKEDDLYKLSLVLEERK